MMMNVITNVNIDDVLRLAFPKPNWKPEKFYKMKTERLNSVGFYCVNFTKDHPEVMSSNQAAAANSIIGINTHTCCLLVANSCDFKQFRLIPAFSPCVCLQFLPIQLLFVPY